MYYCAKKGIYQKNSNGKYKTHSKEYCHAIVLCGSYDYNSTHYYMYMDPNNSDGYTVNSVPKVFLNNSSNTFYFIPDIFDSDYYYNQWVQTYSYVN